MFAVALVVGCLGATGYFGWSDPAPAVVFAKGDEAPVAAPAPQRSGPAAGRAVLVRVLMNRSDLALDDHHCVYGRNGVFEDFTDFFCARIS